MKSSCPEKERVKPFLSEGGSMVGVLAILVFLIMIGFLLAADINEQIEAAVRNSYVFKTFLKGDDIQIRSRDGIVILTGTVAAEPHLFLAAETVANLPGVNSVDNQLAVRGRIPEKNSDAWIQIMIQNRLLLQRNLDNDHPVVDVKNGLVILRGEAGSQAEKELTSEFVRDLSGVKEIRNEMTVAREPAEKRRTVEEFIDDASIKAQIKWALAFHRGTSPFRVAVTVTRGVVTLSGMAKNAAEKELVGKRIEDIRGIVSIDNRMIIK